MNKSQIRFAMAAHAAWLLMNRFAVDGRSLRCRWWIALGAVDRAEPCRSLRFEIRFIAQVSGTSGAPASFVSEWGKRRHRAPNVTRRQSMREIAERVAEMRQFISENFETRGICAVIRLIRFLERSE